MVCHYTRRPIGGAVVKNLPANAKDAGLIPGLGRCPGEKNGNLTPIFLPGKSHGQRSLAGYSPRGCRVGHDKYHLRYQHEFQLLLFLLDLPSSAVFS